MPARRVVAPPPPPPPPPPPEPVDENVGEPVATVAPPGVPDRVTVGVHLKYGLPNYGSVTVDVDYETSMVAEDQGDPLRMYARARNTVNEMFRGRDAEIRAATGLK
jgi:hypothetical protein